jgi:predicted aspartyl protease
LEIDDDSLEAANKDDPQISLPAMTGIMFGRTIQLATMVANITMATLIDTSSTQCFIATAMAAQLGLTPSHCPGMTVGVANGGSRPHIHNLPVNTN